MRRGMRVGMGMGMSIEEMLDAEWELGVVSGFQVVSIRNQLIYGPSMGLVCFEGF